jgi:hypothetical protein
MTTLHLGVIDIPYATNVPEAARRVVHRTHKNGTVETFTAPPSGGETTGDVATILEEKYHVMEVFAEEVGMDLIAQALEHSAAGAIENLLLGAPPEGLSLTAEAEGEIEGAFRHFLDQREMDGVMPGVATEAAKKGVNHRLKHPYAKANKERSSFVDTGTYQTSFKAWAE